MIADLVLTASEVVGGWRGSDMAEPYAVVPRTNGKYLYSPFVSDFNDEAFLPICHSGLRLSFDSYIYLGLIRVSPGFLLHIDRARKKIEQTRTPGDAEVVLVRPIYPGSRHPSIASDASALMLVSNRLPDATDVVGTGQMIPLLEYRGGTGGDEKFSKRVMRGVADKRRAIKGGLTRDFRCWDVALVQAPNHGAGLRLALFQLGGIVG